MSARGARMPRWMILTRAFTSPTVARLRSPPAYADNTKKYIGYGADFADTTNNASPGLSKRRNVDMKFFGNNGKCFTNQKARDAKNALFSNVVDFDIITFIRRRHHRHLEIRKIQRILRDTQKYTAAKKSGRADSKWKACRVSNLQYQPGEANI